MKKAEQVEKSQDCLARWVAQSVFDRPLAMEAGAGTGKTATLVSRIISWCVGVGWAEAVELGEKACGAQVLDGIVGITFTEDAAAEMAERVAMSLQALSTWEGRTRKSADCPDVEELLCNNGEPGALVGLDRRALPASDEDLRSRARSLLMEIHHLRLTTIHSFARSLLIRFPVEAGLHPAFQLDESGEQTGDLVDEILSEALLNPESQEYSGLLGLAAEGIGAERMSVVLPAIVESGVSPVAFAEERFSEEILKPLMEESRQILEATRPQVTSYSEIKSSSAWVIRLTGEILLDLSETLDGKGSCIEKLEALRLRLSIEEINKVRRKIKEWADGKFNRPQPADPEEYGRLFGEFLPFFDFFRRCNPQLFLAAQQVLHQLLIRIIEEKERRGLLSFQDLLIGARSLLENNSGVRRLMRSEIRQLLVDEMQDTDAEQAAIVRQLCLVPDGDGPCLFLVGDPKQSIYGWRSADLGVYESLVEEIEREGGELHRLVLNFRSIPAILDEVEHCMAPVMKKRPGIQAAFVPLLACDRLTQEALRVDAQGRRSIEFWSVSPVDQKNILAEEVAARESEAIAKDISAMINMGQKASKIAILLRGMTHVEILFAALRKYEIPYISSKERGFYRRTEILQAMALLRLILDPLDVLALVAVLRSPIVGIPDGALAPLWREGFPGKLAAGANIRDSIERAAGKWNELPGQIKSAKALTGWPHALNSFVDTLLHLRQSFAGEPPDLFMEKLRNSTLLEILAAARFPAEYRLANIEVFLGKLEAWMSEGLGAPGILRRLRRMSREQPDEASGRPGREDDAAIRVMTIHGAKGLEFTHVYLMQVHALGGGPTGGKDFGIMDGALELFGSLEPRMITARQRANTIREAETLRLLYVALTRAERRLVISGKLKDTRRKSFLSYLKKRRGLKGESGWVDPATGEISGALWRELPPLTDRQIDRPRGVELPAPDSFKLENFERLKTLASEAEDRQKRRWVSGVSREAHELEEPPILLTPEPGPPVETPKLQARPAAELGTAMHRVLEIFDFAAADPEAELFRCVERTIKRESIHSRSPVDFERGLRELGETFRSGPLWERWLACGKGMIGREVPVLAAPPDHGPVAALLGVIDCLYRDVESGELVIVDFKTDDPSRIEMSFPAYARQLQSYADILQRALDGQKVDRCELWYLRAGIVREMPGT